MSKLSLKPDWNEMVEFVNSIRSLAIRKDDEVHDAGWALARTVEIPRNMCCLHNASIDDAMTGWCAGNPGRLEVAKQAIALVEAWRFSNRADRIYKRAWNRWARANGACLITH